MFWIAGGLLVPVVVGLLFFFVWSIVMLGGFVGTYVGRTRREKRRTEWIESLGAANPPSLGGDFESLPPTPFTTAVRRILENPRDEASVNHVISKYEIAADRELGKYRLLVKMGPILGLMGTLIPMGPALAGLSSGDIASMAYNMQVAFATTVLGLVVGAVGFILLQVRQRWAGTDMEQLDYIANLCSQAAETKPVQSPKNISREKAA